MTVKNRAPEGVSHAATSGLRLASQAAFVGSMRPGLNLCENDVSVVSLALSGQAEECKNVRCAREGDLAV